jgi:hypothetical protein
MRENIPWPCVGFRFCLRPIPDRALALLRRKVQIEPTDCSQIVFHNHPEIKFTHYRKRLSLATDGIG